MHTSIRKRLVSFLLVLVLAFGLVPVVATPEAEAAADYATIANKVRGLPLPMANARSTSLPASMDGLWLICAYAKRADGSSEYVMDTDRPESGNQQLFPEGYAKRDDWPTTYAGYAVDYGYTNQGYAYDRSNITRITGNANSCTFQSMDGRYWNFEAIDSTWAGLRLRTGVNSNTFTITQNGSNSPHFSIKGKNNYYLYSNSWTFRARTSNSSNQQSFLFIQISEVVLSLWDVLQETLPYVVDNSGGRFDPAIYEEFLGIVDSAASVYSTVNKSIYLVSNADKSTIETQKTKVRNALAKMKLSESVRDNTYSLVLDYGKPVELNLSAIQGGIAKDSKAALQYMGVALTGNQGFIEETAPSDLQCGTPGLSYGGSMGTLKMTSADMLEYTPTTFMNGVETFCVVHKATTTSAPGYEFYVTTEVRLIPANTMYYEAEDFTDKITLIKKIEGQDTQNQWINDPNDTEHKVNNYRTDGPGGGTYQDADDGDIYIPDYRNHSEVLFFGFDNRPEDRERYASLPAYGGVGNYDDPSDPDKLWYVYKERPKKVESSWIDAGEGTMVVKALAQCTGSGTDLYPDIYMDTIYGGKCNVSNGTYDGFYSYPLNYDTSNAEIVQYRFKMENFRVGTIGNEANSTVVNPFVKLQYVRKGQTINSWIESTGETNISTDILTRNEYVVVTMPVSDTFRTCGGIHRIRAYWGGIESISEAQRGILTVDYIYIGPAELAPVESTYGWDSSYTGNSHLSDGESLFVRGNGVRNEATPDPKDLTEMYFTFTGTGFDLITRTGPNQGAYRMEIYKEEDRSKAVTTISSNNKGTQDLYQIPAISVHDLEHGTYFVSLMINKASNTPFEFLNWGEEFYLDAIRIYDPIDVSQGPNATEPNAQIAYAAYCADGEAYPVIKEVRNILLSAPEFETLNGTIKGAVYVDMPEVPEETVPATDADGEPTGGTETIEPDLDITDNITGSISTYEKVGAKNEVYLGPKQKIAFKLVVKSTELPKLAVGCKTIQGTTDGSSVDLALLTAKNGESVLNGMKTTVRSATAQYYTIPMWDMRFAEDTDEEDNPIYFTYMIIENTGDSGVLSVTDIKLTWESEPTLPGGVEEPATYEIPGAKRNGSAELPVDSFVDFVVDEELPKVLQSYMEGPEDILCEHIPGYWDNEIPATPNGEGYREAYCVLCNELCLTQTPEALGELAFAGTSVSLHSDLAIHYKVEEAFFTEMRYRDPYVVIRDNGTEVILKEYEAKDGMVTFVYRNIAPHRIGDTMTATLYAYHGDTLYCSQVKEYSVADYCYNMLEKTEGEDSYDTLRTLLVDILLYGAKTQEFMSYRLDSLCTAHLTEAQLACGTEVCRELVNHRNQKYETVENPEVLWKGAGLNLRESVAIRYLIQAEHYDDLEARITIGEETCFIPLEDFDFRADGTYIHFTSITAAQMSEPIYITLYRYGKPVSNTVCYSVESYAYSKQNDTTTPYLAELVKRMMCYGDSAKAYMG